MVSRPKNSAKRSVAGPLCAPVLGLDFGTSSVRALIVDAFSGETLGSAARNYPHGVDGVITSKTDPHLARQDPHDYPESMQKAIRTALHQARLKHKFDPKTLCAVGVSATGSTPIPMKNRAALALFKEFRKNPDAMAWLWKDHTAHAEAEEITDLARKQGRPFLSKCGGVYSSEWYWSKILRCHRANPMVAAKANTWIELSDWIPYLLMGAPDGPIPRNLCAAGHKAMYHESWGGLPAADFLDGLHPGLSRLREDYARPVASDARAGTVPAYAARINSLPANIPVAVGAIDAHLGAVGSGCAPGTLVKIIGTSTCDCIAVPLSRELPDIPGVCGIVAALRRRGERRVYKGPQRFAIGMPCGGVAAGQLYVLGDGTLGGWHVDGRLNSTGWGSDNYKVRPQPRELIQGFSLLVHNPDRATNRSRWIEARMADVERGGSFDGVEFIGEYPIAEVRYGCPLVPQVPIEVTLRVGSPFIPLNAKDSCLPCTLMRFELKNTGKAPLLGSLVGYIENGLEKSEPGEVQARRLNTSDGQASLALLKMDAIPEPEAAGPRPERVLFDFEGDQYEGWDVKGKAFGTRPAKGKFPTQQPVSGFEGHGLVNSYADNDDLTGEMLSKVFEVDRRFLTFLIGGGHHPGKACLNLLVDGKIVRTATGRNEEKLELRAWDVRDLAGKQARLQIVDAQKGPWGHINVDAVRLVDTLPKSVLRPQKDSLTYGSMVLAAPGRAMTRIADTSSLADLDTSRSGNQAMSEGDVPLVGGVASTFNLPPGESCEITFMLAWHFPNLHTGQGQMYTNWFNDATDVVKYVHANLERLTRETDLFRKTWYDDTTLPSWLASRLFMPTSNLATGTAQWWKNGRFWGWEGVGCCSGTCTHVWNYSHAEARLFPELARSTRTMQDLGSGFEESTGRVAFRGEVRGGSDYAGDGQSGTVLKCYREHLCSRDDKFLKANWARIKKVLDYQVARDAMSRGKDAAAGEADGMIVVAQPNTYDIDFEGPNTFVGSLYLASLLAGAKMAEAVGDNASADRYRTLAAKGREFSEEHLFESGYFIQQIPQDASNRWQYGNGCLSDQLFGQNWSRCLSLGTLYDESKVQSALKAVYRHNWAPAVGQYSAKFPPERWFAQGKEGGLFICTWPVGGRPNEPVRYRDEVWTGCEYQAAGGMIWEGLTDEALAILRAIDERYDGRTHNPWNEVECGDHYARAMASYGAYQALCGFTYDGPAGTIGIAPRLNPDKFAAFFSGANGWGLATQTQEPGRQVNTIAVRHGELRLTAITAEVAAGMTVKRAELLVKGELKQATFDQSGNSVRAHWPSPLTIPEGSDASVTLSM